jgi:Fic family protein
MRHVLSPAERARGRRKAGAPEARRKYRETMARYRSEEKEAVRILRAENRLVPLAIGPALHMPDSTVTRYLRELESEGAIEPIPSYLSLAPGETA